MSSLKNSVQLIGNLGSNPEVKVLESGKKVAKFSIAVNETYKNGKGEKVASTNWFNLVAWDKTADLVEKMLIKGSEIAVAGKLSTSSYESKEGIKKYVTDVIVDEFLIFSGGNAKE